MNRNFHWLQLTYSFDWNREGFSYIIHIIKMRYFCQVLIRFWTKQTQKEKRTEQLIFKALALFLTEIMLLYNLPVTVLRLVSKGHVLKVLRRYTQIIHNTVEEPIQTVTFRIHFAFQHTSSALNLFLLKRLCLYPSQSFQHPPTACEQCHEQAINVWTTCHAITWTTLRQS